MEQVRATRYRLEGGWMRDDVQLLREQAVSACDARYAGPAPLITGTSGLLVDGSAGLACGS